MPRDKLLGAVTICLSVSRVDWRKLRIFTTAASLPAPSIPPVVRGGEVGRAAMLQQWYESRADPVTITGPLRPPSETRRWQRVHWRCIPGEGQAREPLWRLGRALDMESGVPIDREGSEQA